MMQRINEVEPPEGNPIVPDSDGNDKLGGDELLEILKLEESGITPHGFELARSILRTAVDDRLPAQGQSRAEFLQEVLEETLEKFRALDADITGLPQSMRQMGVEFSKGVEITDAQAEQIYQHLGPKQGGKDGAALLS